MEKFIAIFAIDGRTTNVQFDVAEKDTIDIRIEYDMSNRQKPIRTIVKSHKENRQAGAEPDICGSYDDLNQVIAVNRLEKITYRKKE